MKRPLAIFLTILLLGGCAAAAEDSSSSSALLTGETVSGIITKAGVLAMIRVTFYLFGAGFLQGSWAQTVLLCLSLATVFAGSMLAYKEKVLKKRLAYSTVSQVSYILFGLALLEPTAMTGALLHVVFHAWIKAALFLSAGAIIYKTGKTRTDECLRCHLDCRGSPRPLSRMPTHPRLCNGRPPSGDTGPKTPFTPALSGPFVRTVSRRVLSAAGSLWGRTWFYLRFIGLGVL